MNNSLSFIYKTYSYFLQNWTQHTSRMCKFIVSLSAFNLIIQIFFITFTLSQTRQLPCDEPLRLYLAVHAISTLTCTLFSIYVHMGMSMLDQENHHTRKLLKRWQHILKMFSIAWFLYGNYLAFFSPTITCALTAPELFNLTCIVVFYGYIIYVTPLLASLLQHVLMPLVIDILQLLHIIGRGHSESLLDCSGATKKEIAEIPIYHLSSTSTSTTNQDEKATEPDHTEVDMIPSISIPVQDCICVICLSPYEENDVLCKLWCKHHFHRKCAFEWLELNALCPLCKRDCRDHSDTTTTPAPHMAELKDHLMLLPL